MTRAQHQQEQAARDILVALATGAQSFSELQQHLPALGPVAVAVALAALTRARRILWSGEGAPRYRLPEGNKTSLF